MGISERCSPVPNAGVKATEAGSQAACLHAVSSVREGEQAMSWDSSDCFHSSGTIALLSAKPPMPQASSPNIRQPVLVWGALGHVCRVTCKRGHNDNGRAVQLYSPSAVFAEDPPGAAQASAVCPLPVLSLSQEEEAQLPVPPAAAELGAAASMQM